MTETTGCRRADASAGEASCETVRWTPDRLSHGHTLPLGRVLDLLAAVEEPQAVGRLLGLLRTAVDAGPAVAIEYVLQGGALKVRQVVADAASAVAQGPDTSIAESVHGHLAALTRGVPDDAVIGLRGRAAPPTSGRHARTERISVLYTLAQDTAWAIHLAPKAPDAGFAPDALPALQAGALLAREVHRIVSRAAAVPEERVDAAEVRLGVRAASLSGRERQICARIAGGLTATTIAAELGIAASTVMTLRKRAYAKLGIHDRLDLRHLAA